MTVASWCSFTHIFFMLGLVLLKGDDLGAYKEFSTGVVICLVFTATIIVFTMKFKF